MQHFCLFFQVAPGEHLDDALPQDGASGNARPTGKVVGIIKRNWRTRGYCGSLQPQEERGGLGAQGVLFCPVERRFPKIRLQTRQVGRKPYSQQASVEPLHMSWVRISVSLAVSHTT